jgi:oxygen-independent coproporphyrinogen-3 oxidase
MAVIEAIYCHIPFCHTICPFCAFAVHGNRMDLHETYLRALAEEFAVRGREHEGAAQRVRSVYIGGGTPSTLSLEALGWLLERLRAAFRLADRAEIAIECNPEDVNVSYLTGLQRLGVTRVSLGLQSLDDATLAALGRNHSAAEGAAALNCMRRAGPENFNADLILGAPGIASRAFREDVETLLTAPPPHLSLYGLDIEERTLFGRDPAIGAWSESHRDQQAESYLWAAERLREAGYRHYEVSNFCGAGREGLQNRIVWDGGNYLGFGTGAHSFAGGARWHNHRHLRAYLRDIGAGTAPVAFREVPRPDQRANEGLMLALRRDSGLDVPAWERQYHAVWGERRGRIASRLVQAGQATWDGRRLALTAPGFLVADAVTEQLMVE